MTIEEARGFAAWAWCKETTKHKTMDVDLAEEFAKILMDQVNKASEVRSGDDRLFNGLERTALKTM